MAFSSLPWMGQTFRCHLNQLTVHTRMFGGGRPPTARKQRDKWRGMIQHKGEPRKQFKWGIDRAPLKGDNFLASTLYLETNP